MLPPPVVSSVVRLLFLFRVTCRINRSKRVRSERQSPVRRRRYARHETAGSVRALRGARAPSQSDDAGIFPPQRLGRGRRQRTGPAAPVSVVMGLPRPTFARRIRQRPPANTPTASTARTNRRQNASWRRPDKQSSCSRATTARRRCDRVARRTARHARWAFYRPIPPAAKRDR